MSCNFECDMCPDANGCYTKEHYLPPSPPSDKWKRIAWEFHNARARMSSFYERLCLAIQIADMENTTRLRKAFPELVEALKGERHAAPIKS